MNIQAMVEATQYMKSLDVFESPTTRAIMYVQNRLITTYEIDPAIASHAAAAMKLQLSGDTVEESEMTIAYEMIDALLEMVLSIVLSLVDQVSDRGFHDVFVECMRQVEMVF